MYSLACSVDECFGRIDMFVMIRPAWWNTVQMGAADDVFLGD